MIPVVLQPEPSDFDAKVRQPGHAWLRTQSIPFSSAPPGGTVLPNYWTHSNHQLWKAYSGVCAYLAIFFEWVSGAASTDHFLAKSQNAGDAYEWSNFRLSCLGPNRNKNKYDDVLDPVGLAHNTFVLNLVSGEISPNPGLASVQYKAAKATIKRLKLDSAEHNAMRARHFSIYLRSKNQQILKELSPFVWWEARRQGLL